MTPFFNITYSQTDNRINVFAKEFNLVFWRFFFQKLAYNLSFDRGYRNHTLNYGFRPGEALTGRKERTHIEYIRLRHRIRNILLDTHSNIYRVSFCSIFSTGYSTFYVIDFLAAFRNLFFISSGEIPITGTSAFSFSTFVTITVNSFLEFL